MMSMRPPLSAILSLMGLIIGLLVTSIGAIRGEPARCHAGYPPGT